MHPTTALADTRVRQHVPLDELLAGDALTCVQQPLIDLDTGVAVAHEALLRGPAGTPWESPLVLLEAAGRAGRLADLEACSLRASIGAAARAARTRPVTLFVNVEPSTLTGRLDVVLDAVAMRPSSVQVVVEITERALAADPAGVLAGAELLRAAGCAIALDDVGVEPASLAFVPVLRPEVVKLDLNLLRTLDDPMTVMVAGAVRAYAETSGAEVVAEGIETPADLTRAMVLGATLGQGWHWGRPTAAPAPGTSAPERFAARRASRAGCSTPWELVASTRTRRAPKELLVPISQTLELGVRRSGIAPMLLSCFQHRRFFGRATARRYAELATHLPLVAAIGEEMPRVPAPGVRGSVLSDGDPLGHEWAVVVLGPHEATALIARSSVPGDGAPGALVDGDRAFDFVVTHDRAVVIEAAHVLIGRLVAS